ncbi:MAG: acyl-CoA dehydrogenase family protein [Elusimicrobia bacterium]|nr:acyl-CoA dehydrogenase family protein [Elusimicrobiota bacterium]
MNLELTEEQKIIRDTAKAFAEKELAPVAAALDRGEEGREKFLANIAKLAELGFMGLNIKSEYGGAEAGSVALSLAITEIARACASTAVTLAVNNLVAEIIQSTGTEEQKKKHLRNICSGAYPAASLALTEPGAGSDSAAVSTLAERDGDGWVLNGSKIFITSAPYAGVFAVFAVTDKAAPKGRGISCFLVEVGTKGLVIGREEHKMGQRASATNEVSFENCRVPGDALLGTLNKGFSSAAEGLAGGRINIGSLGLGIGLAAIDYATAYAANRKQFGRSISEFQAVQWMIAESYTELEAGRMLLMNAAARREAGKPHTKEAAMCKMYATEAANRACYNAVQLLGGYGYTDQFPVERYARDARVTSIYEGTNEVQRFIVAREILKSI